MFTGLSAGVVDGPGCSTLHPGTQHSLAHGGPQPAGARWEAGLVVELCAAGDLGPLLGQKVSHLPPFTVRGSLLAATC